MGRRGIRKAQRTARPTEEFFGVGLPDVSATSAAHAEPNPYTETATNNPSSSHDLRLDSALFAPPSLSEDRKAEFLTYLYQEALILYGEYKTDTLPILNELLFKFPSNYRRRVLDRDTYAWHVDLDIVKQFAEGHLNGESRYFSINGALSTGVKVEDIVITVVDRVGELEVILCFVKFFLETARRHENTYGKPHEQSLITIGLILFHYRHKAEASKGPEHQRVWDWFYQGRKSRLDTKENLVFTSPQKIPILEEGEIDEMGLGKVSVGDKIYQWLEYNNGKADAADGPAAAAGEVAGAVVGSAMERFTPIDGNAPLADITNDAGPANGASAHVSANAKRNKKKKEKKKAAKAKARGTDEDLAAAYNPGPEEDFSALAIAQTVDEDTAAAAPATGPGPANGVSASASAKGKGKGKARDTDEDLAAYNPGPDDVSAPAVAHTVEDDDAAAAAPATGPGPADGVSATASTSAKGKGKARDTGAPPAYNPGPNDVSAPGVAHTVEIDDPDDAAPTAALPASAGFALPRLALPGPASAGFALPGLSPSAAPDIDASLDRRRGPVTKKKAKDNLTRHLEALVDRIADLPTSERRAILAREQQKIMRSETIAAAKGTQKLRPTAPRRQFEIGQMTGWADDLEKMQIDGLRRAAKKPEKKEEEKKKEDEEEK
ncbi:hypothetical protein LTS15_001761 [Exophiala xenobiotica]|nr:hypothetical protein LTS15_001761 [Exophiala xenobiotica]